VTIKARIKTPPIKQWGVMREFNRRMKRRFDEVGIDLPFPHRTVLMHTITPPPSPPEAAAPESQPAG
jgi:small conductance mechanosensitive channel